MPDDAPPRAAEPWRCAALALLCLALPSDERVGAAGYSATADLGDLVVRRVGDQEIRASDVFHLLDMASPGMTADATEELVLMAIVEQEARREGVDVDRRALDAEVDRTLAEQRARFAMEVRSDVTLEEFVLARHGWDQAAFRRVVERGVLGNLLLDRVVRLHTFRTARDELQVIVVPDEALALEIAGKLAEGASFSVLARNHSIHPSAPDGGFMPPLPIGLEVPLVAGREGLQPGEFLGPAPITLGDSDSWRLVRLVDRITGDPSPWSALRPTVEADLQATPVYPDELTLFEAAVTDRYAVSDPRSAP